MNRAQRVEFAFGTILAAIGATVPIAVCIWWKEEVMKNKTDEPGKGIG